METSQTDLAEQRVALLVIEKVHIGKHEGVSPLCTVGAAKTPPLYFTCRNWLATENVKIQLKGIQGKKIVSI